jgi:uncharacterized Zn finger protein
VKAYQCQACGKRRVNAVIRTVAGSQMTLCPKCAYVHADPTLKAAS